MNFPNIVKADGTIETFDPVRLTSSLRRAGVHSYTAERIADSITKNVTPGALSKDIYRRALALLRTEGRPIAARYALRRAMLELGPTGHPFEDFVSRLFVAEGWTIETRKVIKGHCVSHEVDFYGLNKHDGTYIAAELKYHNDPSYKTDLKVALYVKSRFDDIFACDPSTRSCPIDRGFLVTNTKFTSEAIAYATCAGVELLGWGYPEDNNLFTRMCRAKIYPVTALTFLSRTDKRFLLEQGVVTVDAFLANRPILDRLHLSAGQVGEVVTEARELLNFPFRQV